VPDEVGFEVVPPFFEMPPMGVGGLEGPLLRQDKKRNDIPISIRLITISAGFDFLNAFFTFHSPERSFQNEE
jgi:hypothetical protein